MTSSRVSYDASANGNRPCVRLWVVAVAVTLLWSSVAAAGEVKLSGFVGAEGRAFVHDPQFRSQFEGVQPSLIVNPELSYDTEDGRHQFSLVPFLRLDARDEERTHVDVREAYWRYVGDDWEVLIGLDTVFWGVTESRHLVNVINQIDQVEDIDEEDFLGQPMVNLAVQRDWGRLDLFALPGFRERPFPGKDGRLRTALPVDDDAAEFESELEQLHVDAAIRYSHFIGDWDIGAYYFYGTGREPRLVPSADGTRLEPRYDLINQVGLDIQYTSDAWLWKFEGIVREGQGDTFAAAVGGFEYSFFQVFETAADIGILAEYLYDGRDDVNAPVAPLDNDVFVGTRLALNDVQDTTALVGAVIDIENQSTLLFIEVERRIGDNWKIELESRWFLAVDRGDPLASFQDDDFVLLRLSRFF